MIAFIAQRLLQAMLVMLVVALIAFMLLRLLHHTAARAFHAGTALLLAQIKIALFRPLTLHQPAKPPPRPPALRPPHPQLCLALR